MTRTASHSRRSVWLGLALVLVLGLTALRGLDAISAPSVPKPVAGASAVELRLTGLLETVVGSGDVQVHRATRPDGTQSFLVMINSASDTADPGDDTLLRLVSSAVFIDTLAGDTVAFDRITFANSGSVLPERSILLELFALVSVCILIGAALAASPVPAPRPASERQAMAPVQSERHHPAPAPERANLIAQRISEDPARAARIVRRWLRSQAVDT
ncbi:MAG: hypothetical protein AAF829_03105 [Pseudomonadota bacterium]